MVQIIAAHPAAVPYLERWCTCKNPQEVAQMNWCGWMDLCGHPCCSGRKPAGSCAACWYCLAAAKGFVATPWNCSGLRPGHKRRDAPGCWLPHIVMPLSRKWWRLLPVTCGLGLRSRGTGTGTIPEMVYLHVLAPLWHKAGELWPSLQFINAG